MQQLYVCRSGNFFLDFTYLDRYQFSKQHSPILSYAGCRCLQFLSHLQFHAGTWRLIAWYVGKSRQGKARYKSKKGTRLNSLEESLMVLTEACRAALLYKISESKRIICSAPRRVAHYPPANFKWFVHPKITAKVLNWIRLAVDLKSFHMTHFQGWRKIKSLDSRYNSIWKRPSACRRDSKVNLHSHSATRYLLYYLETLRKGRNHRQMFQHNIELFTKGTIETSRISEIKTWGIE